MAKKSRRIKAIKKVQLGIKKDKFVESMILTAFSNEHFYSYL